MSFQRDFLSKKITDPLAKKVHDLAKDEYAQNFQVQNIDTLNAQILSIKTKTKTLSKDKFHISVKSYDPEQRFYNAVYPDRDKMKLWLKGENSDQLHDYSLLNHNAHLWSAYQVAEQYIRDDPDNMAGHEIISHANGTHYIHVEDNPDLRISNLIVDEPTNDGFTIIVRYFPLTQGTSNQESTILEQKIDSSQNRYGHSVNVDNEGNIYFYVKYNYRQYFVKINEPIIAPTNVSNYAAENYRPENYQTEGGELEYLLDESYDLVCQFNYATKECSIKVFHDGTLMESASSLTGETAIPPGCQIHLPLQEGKWSEARNLPNNIPMNQVFDSSSNQLTATIFNPENVEWQADNTLKLKGTTTTDGGSIFIDNNAAFNSFTEMTLSFWYKPIENNALTNRLFIIGYDNTAHVKVHRSGGANDLRFSISLAADGTNSTQVEYNNAFPTLNQWYFVTLKWKSGEPLKISINNGADTLDDATRTGTFTELTRPFEMVDWREDNGIIINVFFYKRQITAAEQTTLFNYGAHLMQLPTNLEPQRLVNPANPPVTNPVTTIYDLPKLVSPLITDYTFINNPASENPFLLEYTCPDGSPGGVPVSDIYNILPGSGGTTVQPFVTVYNLPKPTGPSTGQIQWSSTASSNEWGYVQQVKFNTSVLYNKQFTEIQVWLNGVDNPTGGTVWLGIIKNDGTKIKFGTSIDPTTIPDAWTSYTKQLLTNTYPLAVEDGIGVIWEGGTGGAVNVHRGGTDNHFDVDAGGAPLSYQNGRRGAGVGEWKSPNPDYSMAGILKTGGNTTGTSPYYTLKNVSGFNILVGEYFPTGSPAIGQTPTHAEFRVYRDTAATNGTISIRHVKSDGTYWATLYEVNVSTLPTEAAIPTTFNFVWENFDYNRAIVAGDRIAVVVSGLTTGNAYVLTNIGNTTNNNYDTTRSLLNYRSFAGVFGSQNTLDISGIIKKGGNTFTAALKFSSTVTRIYERAVNSSSSFYDVPLSRVVPRGLRVGTIPAPSTITARLRNSAGVEKVVIGTLDANSIGTTLQDIQFTNNNNEIKVAATDYVSIEISTCDASNYIQLNINTNVADSSNSVLGTVDAGITNDMGGYDMAGRFYSGGQIDNTSRPRVSQYIDTQDSIFLSVPNNRITIFEATLTAVGAPVGTIFINIRRGFDDALIFNLGQVAAGGITTALSGTTIHIENFNNTYILSAKDKISIEFEGGDPSNKIGVQIRTVTPEPGYDGANSYVARYNGVEYDYLVTKDLVSKMQVGGDTYTPDPNAPPPVLPQNPTDLYILSDVNKRDNSFMRCLFGMYLFFNTLLTEQELLQFNITRIDTGNRLPSEIQVTNHSFFRNS